MSHCVCHIVYVTSCMSHCVCHIVYVTLCMSHCVCHIVYATLCMSHCVCHIVYVTLCMPHHVCHIVYVTLCMSHCVKPKGIAYFQFQITLNRKLSRKFKKGCKFTSHVKQNCTKKSHITGPACILSWFLSALPATFNNSVWSRSYFLCLIVFNHHAIWNSVLCNYTIDSKVTESSASIFLLWGTKCCPCFVMEGCIL